MPAQIKTTIKCSNIAPIDSIDKTFESSGLKLGIFASNGSGKTYLSRMFRLLENTQVIEEDESGGLPTDLYLSFDKSRGDFSFKVVSREGVVVEDTSVNIEKGKKPTIGSTHYIFHTFNQDYVEDNIRALNYEKDDTIEGFILGKTNIDLSDDEKRLSKIKEEGETLHHEIESKIESSLDSINDVRDIKRLNEYKLITLDNLLSNDGISRVEKSANSYLDDYNKVKSIPENLPKVDLIENSLAEMSCLDMLSFELKKEYSLSSFAEEFKAYVKQEHAFIEQGLNIYSTNKRECPFCKRELDAPSLQLIDKYTAYLNDSEAKTIKLFQQYRISVQRIKDDLKDKSSAIAKSTHACPVKMPELVEADKIYLNRRNRRIMKLLHIKVGGKPLGRPPRPMPEKRNMRLSWPDTLESAMKLKALSVSANEFIVPTTSEQSLQTPEKAGAVHATLQRT